MEGSLAAKGQQLLKVKMLESSSRSPRADPKADLRSHQLDACPFPASGLEVSQSPTSTAQPSRNAPLFIRVDSASFPEFPWRNTFIPPKRAQRQADIFRCADRTILALCHVISCDVMSCHVMSCHVMSCHDIRFQDLPRFSQRTRWSMLPVVFIFAPERHGPRSRNL